MRIGFLIAGLAVAVIIIAGLQWFTTRPDDVEDSLLPETAQQTPPTPATPVDEPSQPLVGAQSQPLEAQPELPSLDDSDGFIRDELSALALPQDWFAVDELVRRAAVVVDNTARGEFPVRQLSFLSISGPFKVLERGGDLYVDPQNYARFDALIDQLVATDPATVADLVGLVTPLLESALAELGNQRSPRAQMLEAIDQILAVPVRSQDIRLIQPKVLYEFAEPRLEKLSPLQKQVLRTGPANTEKLQDYLGRLRPLL